MTSEHKLPQVSILGAGCVTPLGTSPADVWKKMWAADAPPPRQWMGAPVAIKPSVVPVQWPEVAMSRLRRSSAISYFAIAAAEDAVERAHIPLTDRTALVFATSNGGVIYTRKFYSDVVSGGTGSPIHFPETVYNAPASHVAARFGLQGSVLSFVGDASAGMQALLAASELLAMNMADHCIVVASEEADWLVAAASAQWKCGRQIVFSEGAVALVLGRSVATGPYISAVHPGLSYGGKRTFDEQMQKVIRELSADRTHDLVLSALGAAPFDAKISDWMERDNSLSRRICSTEALGEIFSMGGLCSVMCAAEAVRAGDASCVLGPVAGWNGQVGGFVVSGAANSSNSPEK